MRNALHYLPLLKRRPKRRPVGMCHDCTHPRAVGRVRCQDCLDREATARRRRYLVMTMTRKAS